MDQGDERTTSLENLLICSPWVEDAGDGVSGTQSGPCRLVRGNRAQLHSFNALMPFPN